MATFAQAKAAALAIKAGTPASQATAGINTNKTVASGGSTKVSTTSASAPAAGSSTTLPQAPATPSAQPVVTKDKTTSSFAIPTFANNAATGKYVAPKAITVNTKIPGQNVTDMTKVDTTKVNPANFVYGKEAMKEGYNQQDRNLQLGAYYAGKVGQDAETIYQDLSKVQSYGVMDEKLKRQTAQDIFQKMGQYQQQQQMPNVDDQLARVDSQYKLQQDAIIKAGAIEDKYTNFNEVKQEIDNVLQLAGQDRINKGYKDMPSDQDIRDIAANAGVTFERAKEIMEGGGWNTLQAQDSFKKEQEMGYNRGLEDAETELNRTKEDMTTQLAALRQNVSYQQKDVLDMAQRNMLALQKMGALRGQSNTTAFVQGVEQVHADAMETVRRLEEQYQAAENADIKIRGRLMDDYNKNLSRAKEDLDMAWKGVNAQMGTNYNSVLSQYSGEALLEKLQSLNDQALNSKIDIFNNYTKAVNEANKLAGTDMESIQKAESATRDIQKDNWTYLNANKGAALKQLTLGDLNSMYQNKAISLDQYRMLHTRVKQMGGEDLSEYGDPSDEDLTTYQQGMSQNMTHEQAVAHTVKQSENKVGTVAGEGAKATAPTLSQKTKDEFVPPEVSKGMEGVANMVMDGTYSSSEILTTKFKKSIGAKNTEDAKFKIAKVVLQKAGDDPTQQMETMKNTLGKGQYIYNALQDVKGTKAAVKYALESVNSKDTAKTFISTVKKLYSRYGKTPDQKVIYEVLTDAGLSKAARDTMREALK